MRKGYVRPPFFIFLAVVEIEIRSRCTTQNLVSHLENAVCSLSFVLTCAILITRCLYRSGRVVLIVVDLEITSG